MSTKTWSATFLDPALNGILNHANAIYLCSAEPTTYTEAVTTFALMTSPIASGDYAKSNGSTSGRKLSTPALDPTAVLATGSAEYYALVDTLNRVIRHVGRYAAIGLTIGEQVAIGPITIELRDNF